MMAPLRMFKQRVAAMGSVLLFSLLVSRQEAEALTIDANLTNLTDVVFGQDLWHASFTLSSGVFQANEGFTIYFEPLEYSDISAPLAPIPTGWDVLSIQPDPLLSAPGFLDGLALVNSPSLSHPFSVNFVWHGANSPGSQRFETYSQVGTFQITAAGQTVVASVPIIPEPGATLWAAGLFAFVSLSARSGFARRLRRVYSDR